MDSQTSSATPHPTSNSSLSPEDIAKALERHNRHHKGDADKKARAERSTAKKH